MKLYLITAKRAAVTNQLLTTACEEVSLEYELVNENQAFNQLPTLADHDGLYRIAVSAQARIIEQLLIKRHTATFYQNYFRAHVTLDNVIQASIILEKARVPLPKTIYGLPQDKQSLKEAAEKLGLPLIIKAEGQSHSIGVMKIDSLASLYSVADYLRLSSTKFILRQFIPTKSSARLIVLGDQVIDSITYLNQKQDFRSNEGKQPQVEAKKFSPAIEATAVKAVQTLGLEFGGVDILLDQKKAQHYLLEVNQPCFFGRAQLCTGTDIAAQMVAYLRKKAKDETS